MSNNDQMKINPASWGVVTANEMRRKIGLPDIGKTIMEKAEESFPIKQKENEERRKREVEYLKARIVEQKAFIRRESAKNPILHKGTRWLEQQNDHLTWLKERLSMKVSELI